MKEEFFKEVTTNVQKPQLEGVEDINEIWNKIKKGINEAAGKVIRREEKGQRNSWFDELYQIILEDITRVYDKMISRNSRQNEQEYKDKRKERIKYLDTKTEYYFYQSWSKNDDNNEAKKFYQEMNSIRKGFKPQTLLIRNKESNIVSNREKVLQRWSAYYEKHYELQDGTDSHSGEE